MREVRQGRCARQGSANARGKARQMRESRWVDARVKAGNLDEARQAICAKQGRANARGK
jgi:hypothetical protein